MSHTTSEIEAAKVQRLDKEGTSSSGKRCATWKTSTSIGVTNCKSCNVQQ